MVRIEVDVETARRIKEEREPIELYAIDGRQIGYFSRPITHEELVEARRLASMSTNGKTLDEVWARIHCRSTGE